MHFPHPKKMTTHRGKKFKMGEPFVGPQLSSARKNGPPYKMTPNCNFSCRENFQFYSLKKKCNQNGSSVELFGKTVPLFKSGAILSLIIMFENKTVPLNKVVPFLKGNGSTLERGTILYLRRGHPVDMKMAPLIFFCAVYPCKHMSVFIIN